MPTPVVTARLQGIDAARFLAACAVPFIHVVQPDALNMTFDLAARFAVPFFFVTSGYFMARNDSPFVPAVARLFRRLAVPFAIWCAVYIAASRVPLRDILAVKFALNALVNGGPGFHLWFLPWLGVCSVMLLMLRRFDWRLLILFAAILYLVGLALGPYCELLFGFENDQWKMRNGPFFGFPFLLAGYLLGRRGLQASVPLALALFVGGGLLQAFEAYALTKLVGEVRLDMFLGTVPFGIGAFLLALRLPPSLPLGPLAYLGRRSFGIYALHLMGLWIFYLLHPVATFTDSLLAVGFALAFATSASLAIDRIPHLRPLVR